MHLGYLWSYLRDRDHLQGQCVDGRIILNGFSRCGKGTDLAQDRDRWWAVVRAVMNHRVP